MQRVDAPEPQPKSSRRLPRKCEASKYVKSWLPRALFTYSGSSCRAKESQSQVKETLRKAAITSGGSEVSQLTRGTNILPSTGFNVTLNRPFGSGRISTDPSIALRTVGWQ